MGVAVAVITSGFVNKALFEVVDGVKSGNETYVFSNTESKVLLEVVVVIDLPQKESAE